MAKVQLPKKLKVGGLIYDVILEKFSNDSKLDGFHSNPDLKIKINNLDMFDPHYLMEVFVHETVHAIDNVYNSCDLEENTIILIAKALYWFILNNKFSVNDSKIPTKLLVGTVVYKIEYPCDFRNYSIESPSFTFLPSELILKISRYSQDIKYHIDKINILILEAFLLMLNSEYNLKDHKDFEELNKRTFAHGIHQVLKDNNLEKVIRSVK